jgi:hypothetical protein
MSERFKLLNYVNGIECLLGRAIRKDEYLSVLKCYELGYTLETTANYLSN